MKGSRWAPSCEYQWVNNTKNVWPPICPSTVNQVIKSFGWQWSQFPPTKNLDPGHKHFNRWHISDYQHLDWFLLAYTSWRKHTQKYIHYILILRHTQVGSILLVCQLFYYVMKVCVNCSIQFIPLHNYPGMWLPVLHMHHARRYDTVTSPMWNAITISLWGILLSHFFEHCAEVSPMGDCCCCLSAEKRFYDGGLYQRGRVL